MAGEMLRAYLLSYFSALGMEPAFLKTRNGIINQMLIESFHLQEVEDDSIMLNERYEFLKSIEK